jgi:hypothetical protein
MDDAISSIVYDSRYIYIYTDGGDGLLLLSLLSSRNSNVARTLNSERVKELRFWGLFYLQNSDVLRFLLP